MTRKVSMVDYWTLARNFKPGDVVARYNHISGKAEDIVGAVTATLPGIGFVDVEFPWGNERVSADEIVKINPANSSYIPSAYDTSYAAWDIDQSHTEAGMPKEYSYATPRVASINKLASSYDKHIQKLRISAQKCKYAGLDEIDAFEAVSRASHAPDHEVRSAVQVVYKQALYWYGEGRKYRMNKGEMADGQPDCPRCKANMHKTNYKKHTKLFVCPSCFFCVKPSDIFGLPEYEDGSFGEDPTLMEMPFEEAPITASVRRKLAKWDALRNQVLNYVKKSYPVAKDFAEDIAAGITAELSASMNVHEDTLSDRELARKVQETILDMARLDIRDAVGAAVRKEDFIHPDEAINYIEDYITGLDDDMIIKLVLDPKHPEWKRLIGIQKDRESDMENYY